MCKLSLQKHSSAQVLGVMKRRSLGKEAKAKAARVAEPVVDPATAKLSEWLPDFA